MNINKYKFENIIAAKYFLNEKEPKYLPNIHCCAAFYFMGLQTVAHLLLCSLWDVNKAVSFFFLRHTSE